MASARAKTKKKPKAKPKAHKQTKPRRTSPPKPTAKPPVATTTKVVTRPTAPHHPNARLPVPEIIGASTLIYASSKLNELGWSGFLAQWWPLLGYSLVVALALAWALHRAKRHPATPNANAQTMHSLLFFAGAGLLVLAIPSDLRRLILAIGTVIYALAAHRSHQGSET